MIEWVFRILFYTFGNLFLVSVASGMSYVIQKQNLDSDQLRIVLRLTKDLRNKQYIPINKKENQLLGGQLIHQIYVSTTEKTTIGLVFLNNQKKVKFPEELQLQGSNVRHFPFKRSVMALWFHGLSEQEANGISNFVKQRISFENGQSSALSRFIPAANAETCDSKPQPQDFNPLIGKITQSSYAYCWEKIGEGASSAITTSVDSIKEKAQLEFDSFSYWAQIQTVAMEIANFVGTFFESPADWIKKNIPDTEVLDLSILAEIDREKMMGLACLTLGNEGLQSLASSLVSGPTGLAVRLFQMVSKLSLVSKLIAFLKKIKNLTLEQIALFKEKILKLAEGLVLGKHKPETADSVAGLFTISPKLAEKGLTCLTQ
jgi:hypothetical protein